MADEFGHTGRDPAQLHEKSVCLTKMVRSTSDQSHTVVTAGYDSISCRVGQFLAYIGKSPGFMAIVLPRIRKYSSTGSTTTNSCLTAARTSDGSLVMAYMPSSARSRSTCRN